MLNRYALGKPGRFLACLFMFVYNFGILCANLLVVGSAVPALLVAITGTDHLAFHREYPQFPLQSPFFFLMYHMFVLLYAFAIILPVCFLKNIASYTWTSAIYVICFVGAVIIFVVVGIQSNVEHNFDRM